MKREKDMSNKIMKGIITSFCTLLSIFFVLFINTISVSANTSGNEKISTEKYILTLQERGGIQEKINGADIGLKYSSNEVTYDENLLKECVNKLSCFDNSKIIESANVNFMYQGNGYVVSNELYGNRVKKDILYNNIVKAIKNGDSILNFESIKCYDDPRFTASSPEVINAKNLLNKYVSSKITYSFGGLTQVLDASIIKSWLWVNSNCQVTIDESKVRSYIDAMANTYTSSLGYYIKVSGGYNGNNHGWVIDSAQETKTLIEIIKSGQTITRYPNYAQTSAASYLSGVGDTFVEVDMTKQHLWFYKNGYLVVQGDVVTGNLSDGNGTPTGNYNLYYKQSNTVLTGPGYAAPVSYWMPFNNNIGLHDASWRSEFGGEIYKTDGSHGCVNLPYYVAKSIYDNINSGVPVICYY